MNSTTICKTKEGEYSSWGKRKIPIKEINLSKKSGLITEHRAIIILTKKEKTANFIIP